jgi:CRP/FNR family cyclic AMP-dependent transcriptional regulator
MTTRSQTVDRLKALGPYTSCSDDELAFIARRSSPLRVGAGTVLVREGQAGREFGVIVEGTATVLVGSHAIARLGPGDYFGELALIDRGPRTATVVADTDVLAEISSLQEFSEIVHHIPAVVRSLLLGTASRMRRQQSNQ